MMSLYKQLRSHFNIPDAYVRWKPYRALLTDYLVRELQGELTPPSLLIIGAGQCNDIDLGRVFEVCSEITLLDYDEAAMREALTRYGVENESRIHLRVESLTGIDDAQYEGFCSSMQDYARDIQGSVSVQELDIFAISMLQSFVTETFDKSLEAEQYDYVWCVGVHSQLNAMFSYIYRVFWENLFSMHLLTGVGVGDGPQDSAFMAYVHDLNTEFIKTLHDAIFKIASKCVIMGCEVDKLDSYYSGMYLAEEVDLSVHPVEGAYQGIMDIYERQLSVDESLVCWPFDENRKIYYDMLIQKIKVYEGD